MITLDQLTPGNRATIINIDAGRALLNRMAGLGIRSGRLVTLLRRAGLGGPLLIRVGSAEVMLRRGEAAKITICHEPDAALEAVRVSAAEGKR